jgi:hypothetical protein
MRNQINIEDGITRVSVVEEDVDDLTVLPFVM